MSDLDPTKPHIYGAPDPAHDADRTVPPTGLHGEQKATSGEGYKREIIGDDGSSIAVEEASGVAAAEAAGTEPRPSGD
jgi:hypothetical protein